MVGGSLGLGSLRQKGPPPAKLQNKLHLECSEVRGWGGKEALASRQPLAPEGAPKGAYSVHTRVMYSVHRVLVMPVYSVHRIQLGQTGPQTQPHGGTGGRFAGGRECLHIYSL